jgi:hypothetical protein
MSEPELQPSSPQRPQSPWSLWVSIPAGIFALGFMVYCLRLFKREHVFMVAAMVSDVTCATVVLMVAATWVMEPGKRAGMGAFTTSRKPGILTGVAGCCAVLSACLHLFGGIPIINSPEYLCLGIVPLLLVGFNKLG